MWADRATAVLRRAHSDNVTMTPERPIPAPTRSIAFEREQSARACGSPSSALGRRDEPPIVRIGKAGQKRLRQRECLEFWVVIELRPAAPGRFNNNIDVPVFGEWRQVDKIWLSQSSKYAVQER